MEKFNSQDSMGNLANKPKGIINSDEENMEKKMLDIFKCGIDLVASNRNEITKDTNAYVGDLEPGVFDLIQKYNIENVIVVAGPQGVTTPSKEAELYSCYFNTLLLADKQNKTSIAFPSISTGIFGFPKDRAAAISLKAIQDFVDKHPNTQLKTISIHYLPNDPISDLEIFRAQIL